MRCMRQALRHIFKEIDHDKSSHVTLAELQEALSATWPGIPGLCMLLVDVLSLFLFVCLWVEPCFVFVFFFLCTCVLSPPRQMLPVIPFLMFLAKFS